MHFSIRAKLTTIFVLLLALMVISTVVTLNFATALNRNIRVMVDQSAEETRLALNLKLVVIKSQRELDTFLLEANRVQLSDFSKMDALEKLVIATRDEFRQNVEELRKVADDPTLKMLADVEAIDRKSTRLNSSH